MGQSASSSEVVPDSPCSQCVVSNRFGILALGLLIFAMCVVVVILIWALSFNQNLQITITVLAAVSALFAIFVVVLPLKCKPCLCVV